MTTGDARSAGNTSLRWGYWMQFWAATYAAYTVWPQPRLTAFVGALLVGITILLYDCRPSTTGNG